MGSRTRKVCVMSAAVTLVAAASVVALGAGQPTSGAPTTLRAQFASATREAQVNNGTGWTCCTGTITGFGEQHGPSSSYESVAMASAGVRDLGSHCAE